MLTLEKLPYEMTELEPQISKETLEYHYGKHHQAYMTNLNNMIKDSEYADMPLEMIIRKATGPLFNNAAQVWNHTFYWKCLSPTKDQTPTGSLSEAINKTFGSYDKFKEEFTKNAIGNFGSGWTWLVRKKDGTLAIENTSNAETVITNEEDQPLLTCDVWEHAYYVDYRNARPQYMENYWKVVNWEFAQENFDK